MFYIFCRTIDRLQAKELVMGLVNHANSEVRMQALLAIQKMMVQNWYANFCACTIIIIIMISFQNKPPPSFFNSGHAQTGEGVIFNASQTYTPQCPLAVNIALLSRQELVPSQLQDVYILCV